MDTETHSGSVTSWAPDGLGSDADLLADALGITRTQERVQCMQLLQHHQGSLRQAVAALFSQAATIDHIGARRLGQLRGALQLATRMAEQRCLQQQAICSASACYSFLQKHYSTCTREMFTCLFLNSRHRLLSCQDLFAGTLNTAAVYPREVVAAGLRLSAAAVIVAHNHPSGDTQPSHADLELTSRLDEALALMDIQLLDHVIVGQGGALSMAESRLGVWSSSPLR